MTAPRWVPVRFAHDRQGRKYTQAMRSGTTTVEVLDFVPDPADGRHWTYAIYQATDEAGRSGTFEWSERAWRAGGGGLPTMTEAAEAVLR